MLSIYLGSNSILILFEVDFLTNIMRALLKNKSFIFKLLPIITVIAAVSILYFRRVQQQLHDNDGGKCNAANENAFCKRGYKRPMAGGDEIQQPSTTTTMDGHGLSHHIPESKTISAVDARVSPGEIDRLMESLIQADENLIIAGLGNGGVSETNVPPGVGKDDVLHALEKEGINVPLSDRISYDRNIPDARHPDCKRIDYNNNREALPNASIVITFHNEPRSLLLRTIHSIINRTPARLIHEIILIDDASDKVDLQDKLTYYVRTRLPAIVKLIRIRPRAGLIRSKQAGAEAASGNVLVFMDAHCEVVVAWLEPLLLRIKQKRDAVVVPVIDWINREHFGYMYDNINYSFYLSALDWSGYHAWFEIPHREKSRIGNCTVCTIMSPTMLGGIYAMNRQYFFELGGYDTAMEIWGAENVEMSLRIWQCGGTLEVHPCSRVGHVFRPFRPYSFNGKDDALLANTARTVEVWTDDYKRLFYLRNNHLKDVNVGNLTDRKLLREKLLCKNFHWYLKNVFPEKFILDEDSIAWGRVRSRSEALCFDKLHTTEYNPYNLTLFYCQPDLSDTQFFSLSKLGGELRREFMCAEIINGSSVIMTGCTGRLNQRWEYTRNGHIRHLESDTCLTCKNVQPEGNVQLESCMLNSLHTQWDWEHTRINNNVEIKHF